jgi:hypothetical protein
MNPYPLIVGALFGACVLGCQHSKDQKETQILFNGQDLSGWDTYLGPEWRETSDSTVEKVGDPVGLNVDPKSIFSVVSEDQQQVIRVSGEQWGGISTTQEYENYHLKLNFKWGQTRHRPKEKNKRDSGLLYHAVGNHGAGGGFWMRSQEFQIQEGDCGDYWGVAGGIMDIPTNPKDDNYVYEPGSVLRTFSEHSVAGRHATKFPDPEYPSGQWNTLELICFGDTAIHIVNEVVVMVLYQSRQLSETGEIPLKKGKIQLQSEGAELFYKEIQLKPITAIPEGILEH